MYKLGKIHVVEDALSILLNILEPTCVFNQTTYASMFYIKLEWLNDVREISKIGQIESTLCV